MGSTIKIPHHPASYLQVSFSTKDVQMFFSRLFWFFFILLITGCNFFEKTKNPIKQFSGEINLSFKQQNLLLDSVRIGLSGQPIPGFSNELNEILGAGAVIELFLPPEKPIVKVVSGLKFQKAFKGAIEKIVSDSRFILTMKPKLDKVRIKVGIINKVERLNPDTRLINERIYNVFSPKTEDAIHGLILVYDNMPHFQIPESVLYNGWALNKKRRLTGGKLLKRQLSMLGKKATGQIDGWKKGELFLFTTFTFIESVDKTNKPLTSFRGKTEIPLIDSKSILAATKANAEYLTRAVGQNGKFNYIYYPGQDEYDTDYSIVRHAGTIYSLFEAYNYTGEKTYYNAGRKALGYLLKYYVVPDEVPHIALIMHNGVSKLGTNALALLAYAVMPTEFMTEQDRVSMKKLGESVLYFMMPEKGKFYTTFEQAREMTAPKKQSRYFPGEAMLALIRMFEKSREKKWWDAAVAIAPIQKKRWQNAGHMAVGDYCWVGQAFARMAQIEEDTLKKDEYKEVAYSHADAVIKHLFRPGSHVYPDYVGGADNSMPPRTTPTSARIESLVESYLLAKKTGDRDAWQKYGPYILTSLRFIMRNQFTAENSWYLPYPEKALGGVRGSLTADDIRIDYNQHALIAMLKAWDVPRDINVRDIDIR